MSLQRNKNIFIWSSSNVDELISELDEAGYHVKGVFGCASEIAQLSGGIAKIKEMVDSSTCRPDLTLVNARKGLLPKFIETYSRLVKSVRKRRFGYDGHGQHYGSYDYYKNRLALYVAFYSSLIDEMNIDAVWFFRPPHLGMDNVLYEVCKEKNIDVIVTWQSLFPDKFFYGQSLEELFLLKKKFREEPKGNYIEPQLNLFYMKENKNTKKSGLRDFITTIGGFYYMFRQKEIRGFLGQYLLNKEAKMKYQDSKGKASFLFPKGNFVYFPLHLQPEATTSILGNFYSDQVDAIEKLSLKCPRGWTVLLKENPKQDYKFRSPEFYNRIARLHNVHWCDPDTSSSDLIKRCRIVATISGTAGYEALLEGKPCIYFGNAWYQELLGSFCYNDEVDFEKIGNFSFELEEFYFSLSRLLESCADGVLYSSYNEISKLDKNKRVKVAAQSLINIDCKFGPNVNGGS